jgi:hypothetical protein
MQVEDAILDGVKDGVPVDHPLRAHVVMTVHELQRNPWWSFEEKYKYVTTLVRKYG